MIAMRNLFAVFALLILPLLALPAQAEVEFREMVSPGGIKALIVEDNTLPIITLAFAFRGGTTQDPEDKLGQAMLMSRLFDEGAGNLDSDAFQIALDEVGLEMGFSAGTDEFTGFARMLAADREEATKLLTMAINTPRFDEPAIERMRSQMLAGLVARSQDPGYAAGRMWSKALFGDHPYARPSEGTEETLPKITADDLRTMHKAIFARANIKLGIAGAIDEATAGAMIDAIFGTLPAEPKLVEIGRADITFGQTLAIDYPLPQTSINLAYPGVPENHPDSFPAFVMTELLAGSSLLSQLNVEVREKRGLSYGVSGALSNFEHAETLTIGTSTRPDQAAETIAVIRATLARMADEGPNAEELARIKRYLIGAYPMNQLRSSVAIAGTMVSQQLRGLPIDYIEQRVRLIDAVTAQQVQDAAKRIFANEPTLLLVGPNAKQEDAATP